MYTYTLGNGFQTLVNNAGGAAAFAKKYKFDEGAINEYLKGTRKIQIGTLIFLISVIEKENQKNFGSSLIATPSEQVAFKKTWDEMYK